MVEATSDAVVEPVDELKPVDIRHMQSNKLLACMLEDLIHPVPLSSLTGLVGWSS